MVVLFPAREVIISIGSLQIRWYGLLWALSFWVIWYLAPRLQKYRGLSFSQDEWTKIAAWGAVGALVGGRVGYVLFYEPAYFLQHPLEVFALWHGGMASHGGFIGAAIAVWLLLRNRGNFFGVLDVLTVPVAVALALGRLGNWINLEIFGNNPIAVGKNLLVVLVCYLVLTKSSRLALERRVNAERAWLELPFVSGSVASLFLILYSILRLFIEPLRDDPWPLMLGMTRGQLLTLPVFAVGVWLLLWLRKRKLNLRQPTPG